MFIVAVGLVRWLAHLSRQAVFIVTISKLTEVCHAGSVINMRRRSAMKMITITLKATAACLLSTR